MVHLNICDHVNRWSIYQNKSWSNITTARWFRWKFNLSLLNRATIPVNKQDCCSIVVPITDSHLIQIITDSHLFLWEWALLSHNRTHKNHNWKFLSFQVFSASKEPQAAGGSKKRQMALNQLSNSNLDQRTRIGSHAGGKYKWRRIS